MWREAIPDMGQKWPSGYAHNTSWAYNRQNGELISGLTHGPHAEYHYEMFDHGLVPENMEDPSLYDRWAFGHLYQHRESPKQYSLAYDSDFQSQDNRLSEEEKQAISDGFDEILKPKTAALPDVNHRMVWLSQPNNQSLKYWHHKPTNTTYAWDTDDTGAPHHVQIGKDIEAVHGKHPYSSNDWEGGFYQQNEMGRHPADIWGLPSQVDYAPIQGDGDYGMF